MEPQDPHSDEVRPEDAGRLTPEQGISVPPPAKPPALPPAAPPPPPPDEEDEEEDHMLRMSFLEHLEELRVRIIRALSGIGIAFALCLFFAQQLWDIVREPAVYVLKELKLEPLLLQTTPMEAFSIIWVKVPLLASVFIASPWVLYQIWGFVAPGLYRKERRLATPFILSCAGLFILGGVFGYFVAFRYGLMFLLSIGPGSGIKPMITVTEYTDLFVNVMIGISLVFEMPVLIFFLVLLRVANPRWLFANSRYAILLITLLAAVVTPTPDVVNLAIFAAPMIMLYFLGVFAGYLLVLRREGEQFPWKKFLTRVAWITALAGVALWLAIQYFGLKLVSHWPFLVR